MSIDKILEAVDHTLLSQTATEAEIFALCDEGIKYKTASVCIPLSYVKRAKDYTKGKVKICTVIGFPNGYVTENVKCFEATEAVALGADEIDMVINIGDVKNRDFDKVLKEIKAVKKACGGKILKVIIETCLLTKEEKIRMCKVVSESGADFIKTSTGFSTNGATAEDIKLFAEYVEQHVKIKAAGGISSLEDAELFMSLGASRLGTSRIVKLIKNSGDNNGAY
ncbi:MAG: deoxyribose-phosphate aldolase [Clostridia bacterium]|nr:deoxyribose-phosphate aldolase [Clostridia bacterium]